MPSDANGVLRVQGLINGSCVLSAVITAANVAGNLAKADEMMASIAASRDTSLSWARKSLETRSYAEDRAMSGRLVATLLWLACRAHPTAEEIEAEARNGGTLDCDFVRERRGPTTS